MKVLHVSFSDLGGGAARAAFRIHGCLSEAGIRSCMRVHLRLSEDPAIQAPSARWVLAISRLRVRASRLFLRAQISPFASARTLGLVPSGLATELNKCDADLVNLHWVGFDMLSVSEIASIRKPLVWTMHDMWPFCGTEHYPPDGPDARFRTGYRSDNRGAGARGPDLDRWVWRRKRRLWRTPFQVVCPSRWLAECARDSVLMRDWPIAVVPNPIDLEQYRPYSRDEVCAELGLPAGKRLLLFGAFGGADDPRKGLHHLVGALEVLARRSPPDLALVVFGNLTAKPVAIPGIQTINLGPIRDETRLAKLYSAADAFVAPSEMDNLPNTVIEALACGTPAVAFRIGGMPDLIEPNRNGYLARPFDQADLADGILRTIAHPRPEELRRAARSSALDRFAPAAVAASYRSIYERVLAEQSAARTHRRELRRDLPTNVETSPSAGIWQPSNAMRPDKVTQAGSTVVVADAKRLTHARRNAALGNKICHLLFLISLCERNDARLAIPVDSNLDEVFDLDDCKSRAPPARRKLDYAFVERSAFKPDSRLGLWLVNHGIRWRTQSVADAARRSREQFELELAFLSSGLPPGAVSVRGHFWHFGLMPSQEVFERSAPLRADLRHWVRRQYPDLGAESSVAVHLRESDFRSHLRHVFKRSILLDDDYYYRATAAVERELGTDLRYHLFSDNPARIEQIFYGKSYIVHRDPAAADWAALYLARNVIQSNSTFCWTACLYNKALSIQPAGGYNYFQGGGDIPYGFRMPFSETIAAQPGGPHHATDDRISKPG